MYKVDFFFFNPDTVRRRRREGGVRVVLCPMMKLNPSREPNRIVAKPLDLHLKLLVISD